MTCEFRSHVIRPLLNEAGHYRKTDAVVAGFLLQKAGVLPLSMGFQPDLRS
jgi:hypothetical protein